MKARIQLISCIVASAIWFHVAVGFSLGYLFFLIYILYFLLFSRPIPSQGHLEETIDLSDWSDLCGDVINHLEHVEVSVNLTYTLRGELLIRLMSPQGTVSNLTYYRMMDSSMGFTDLNWVLMTLHHWGESAPGIWRLTLRNSNPSHDNTGLSSYLTRNKYWRFLGFKQRACICNIFP